MCYDEQLGVAECYIILHADSLFEGFTFEGHMFLKAIGFYYFPASPSVPSHAVCSSQALPVINPTKDLR